MMLVAVPVEEKGDLDSKVADTCARAPYIILVELGDGESRIVKTIENPALEFKHGAGPIFVKTLMDEGVEAVTCPDIGESVSELLLEHDIKVLKARPGQKMMEVISR